EGWQPPGLALQVPPSYGGIEIVSAESVAAAHHLGLEVHVWTIDDAAEMDALLDLGVDGIMTNLPALGMAVVPRRGLRWPTRDFVSGRVWGRRECGAGGTRERRAAAGGAGAACRNARSALRLGDEA